MNGTILVTYATCTGSTTGVAEAIGETMAECGHESESLPAKLTGEFQKP